jgi:mono/diheme cytochrome c family protein
MKLKLLTGLAMTVMLFSCGGEATESSNAEAATKEEAKTEDVIETISEADPMSNKGVGPITDLTLEDIDEVLVEKGKEVYKANCTACHKIGKRSVGPALKGITERRSPEWIMNMILNPEGMVEEDPDAKALLAEYLAPMANQSLSEEDARALLEFFRTKK